MVKLLFPEFLIGLWKYKVTAVFMGVPETSVYKDNCIISWEDKVGFTRVSFVADSVSETSLEKGRTYLFFGHCIFCPDMRHVFVTVFGRKNIHMKILLCNSGFFYIFEKNRGIINIFNVAE